MARGAGFFLRALFLLLFSLSIALGMGHVVGRVYRPQPLSPTFDRVHGSDHFLLICGNSRFDAAINPGLLASTLSHCSESKVDAQMYVGGGWDSIHYYMLALLSRNVLRSGKDGVIIEISPLSLNDAESDNRINVVRPEVAMALADLPGEPVEDRLKILVGAVASLYRYRPQIQSKFLYPRLHGWSSRVAARLERCGLVKPVPSPVPFRLVFAPGREFVVQELRGNQESFRMVNRQILIANNHKLRFGGYKYHALERAVRVLRDREINVYLVQTPTSLWFKERLFRTKAGESFQAAISRLAESTGAVVLTDWPPSYYDGRLTWDETHLLAHATDPFTSALAKRLAGHITAVRP